jgi:hypothetical protein
MRVACWINKATPARTPMPTCTRTLTRTQTHTEICNNYCFSKATMVSRTRLIVVLCVYCCLVYNCLHEIRSTVRRLPLPENTSLQALNSRPWETQRRPKYFGEDKASVERGFFWRPLGVLLTMRLQFSGTLHCREIIFCNY